jgi:molybdate transport system substrate-binding protein
MNSWPLAVMSTLRIQSPLDERIGPAFEEQTGSQLAMTYDPTTVLLNAIGSGRRTDAIFAIDTLVKDKALLPFSRVGIARTTVGLAKRAGSAPIDISTPASFINAPRATKSIVFSQSGTSGIFFDSLIETSPLKSAGRQSSFQKVSPLSCWFPARPNWPCSK